MTVPDPLPEQFRRALRSLDDEGAEQLLREAIGTADEDAVASTLFDQAAYGGPHDFWPIVDHLVSVLGTEWLETRAWQFAEPYLDGSDSRPFRELAILFREHQADRCLRKLLERAARFDDFDIRNVIEEFGPAP